jgi:hypothetical protein
MDIGKALSHVFDDEDWPTKIIVGTVILMVPILNFAAIGYQIQLARNVVKKVKRPLPEWNDFGSLFIDGLWMALASVVYSVPLAVLALFPAPFALIATIFCINNEQACVFIPWILLLMVGTVLLSLLGAIVLGMLRPGIISRFVQEGTFSSCFQLGAIGGFIKRNLGSYAAVYAVTIGLGFLAALILPAASMMMSFIPCLGPILPTLLVAAAGFMILMVTGHMIGQLVSIDLAASPDDTPALVKAK